MAEKETSVARNPQEYYIIDTRTRNTRKSDGTNPGWDWREVDLQANAEYNAMCEDAKHGRLGKKIQIENLPYNVKNRAANFHELSHMSPETVKYQTERGFIWIKDREDALNILTRLKKIDEDVELSMLGKQL
jgi:hypothetical protein